MKPAFLSDLLEQIANMMPDSSKQAKDTFIHNIRPLVEAGFNQLNIVTKEEFDQQQALLAQLEQRAAKLESELALMKDASAKPEG